MAVRKNFVFDDETARTLEEIAKEAGISQTEAVKRGIAELKEKRKREKRLEALEKLAGSVPPGSLVDIDMRQVRIEKALKHAN